LRDIEIHIPSQADCSQLERSIDQAIAAIGLNVTLRSSLAKFPGCVHWHVKQGREPGTLEITLWPQKHRAWFTIQDGRKAPWIDEKLIVLTRAIVGDTPAG
jgi:hypothetical protein